VADDTTKTPAQRDRQDAIDSDTDWYEDGQRINGDVMLHEEWGKR
jgi:hypothetical protein